MVNSSWPFTEIENLFKQSSELKADILNKITTNVNLDKLNIIGETSLFASESVVDELLSDSLVTV